MKFIKRKILILTTLLCLSTVLLGLAVWNQLPETMAIHFDINGNPDNFAPKSFVVFGLPCLMALLQIFCCFINDINAYRHGERKKFEMATKWIIPVMTVLLQSVTLGYGLGLNPDIRRIVSFLVGAVLIVIGNYLPKFGSVSKYDENSQKARKINRFIGFETVVMGLLFILSIFLPPAATVVCLFLLIPYALMGIIYGIKSGRQ